jgi:hypothetical protein
MDDFKRSAKIGGGGWNCPCCGPNTSKDKATIRQLSRRRLKAETIKETKENVK